MEKNEGNYSEVRVGAKSWSTEREERKVNWREEKEE